MNLQRKCAPDNQKNAGHLYIRATLRALLAVLSFGLSVNLTQATPISGSSFSKSGTSRVQKTSAKRAQAALRRGDVDEALRHLREARKKQPELAPAEVLLAHLYLAGRQTANASRMLEQAAVLFPNDPEAHLMFADRAWRERRLSDAEVQYSRGMTLAEAFEGSAERKQKLQVWALAGRGSVAEARRNPDLAREHFTQLLKLDPTHSQALTRLGHVLFTLDQPKEALAQFRAAEKSAEGSSSPELTLASLYLNSGNAEQALQWIEQAIKSDSGSIQPLIAIARYHLEIRNDPREAEKYIAQAAKIDRSSTELQLLSGLAAWQRGDLAYAKKRFEAIVLQQPSNVTANAHLASVLAEEGSTEQLNRAWEIVQLTAKTNPNSLEIAAALGWVAYQLEKWQQAEQQLQVVAEAPGATRDVQYYYARALYRRGKLSAARKALNEAIDGQGLFVHLRDAQRWHGELSTGN